MKITTTVIALLFLFSSLSFASADIFFPDEDIFLHCDNNEKYNVSNNLQSFNHIVISDDYTQFNTTAFHCDFDGVTVNTTINFLNIMEAYGNLTILNFSFEQSGSNFLEWNITNFQNNQVYRIYTNDSYMDDITSDLAGWLNFTVDIYEGFVEIVQYEYILFLNENPSNNSWVIFNLSGQNTSLAIEYSNFNPASDNHLIINLSWWNATSGSWQYYLNTTIDINKTVYILNVNFSDVYNNSYLWKCEALANDTGITRTETFGFSVFPYIEEKGAVPIAIYISLISGVILCFGLLLKKTDLFVGFKRKKKEKA